MKSKMQIRIPQSITFAVLSIVCLVATPLMSAQTPARFVGAITAINGDTLTVKTDAGDLRQVQVPSSAAIKRVSPGQKDLSTAETMLFSDLAAGDRVLVKLSPDASGPVAQALQIIAIKLADVAKKQQMDREDWQRRGVGGLVKSVDASSGVIMVGSGAGATAKTITIHTTKATTLKRYAPASVRYDAAVIAPIDAIHPGDQLRARGSKNADGTEITAEDVVSGSFRNISGTIVSLDAAGSTVVVKDLATKKQVTIHFSAEAQMRRLPETMATMLAARLKGASGGSTPAQNVTSGTGEHNGAGQLRGPVGAGSGQGVGGYGGDPQQMLSRAPAIQLADLKKGEAVMLVSTEGDSEVSAITLLAGVEPLLEAPAASQNLLSNWSMNSSAAEAAQ